MTIDIRWAIEPKGAARMSTDELRRHFLVQRLFEPGQISLCYTHYDRMIIGGATPTERPLVLETAKPLGTAHFLERRELIAVNIGGAGSVTVGSESFEAGPRDMVYCGMGTHEVSFASANSGTPAKFYLLSAPAHAALPARLIRIGDAVRMDLGSQEAANQRSIYRFVHPGGAQTCQLVVGMTTFAPGSIWNTMPPHVHDRRMEAYLYFDLPETARVVHLMGEPSETRHLIVANEEAVISPAWSIHAGVGTAAYAFIWAMAGDNVDYSDVDPVPVEALR